MKAASTVALALILIVSPIHAKENHAPLPAGVMAAKTVYIDNKTGEAAITDRAYDAISKWGRFKIVKQAKRTPIWSFCSQPTPKADPPHPAMI